jgi:aldose 1-epimerase
VRVRCIPFAIVLFLVFAAKIRADVTASDFGNARDGTAVRLFTIANASGSSVRIMTYGAAVVSLKVPDRFGNLGDIILGYETIDGYLRNDPFFGAIVGRYANRIRGATFSLDGARYKLSANDHGNTLHGGRRGFDKVVWTAGKTDGHSVEFTYFSKDGEEGFPGNLAARVRYSLNDANELAIDYSATTDKDTVVNLANHSYFNLAGAGNGDVLNHELLIDAEIMTTQPGLQFYSGNGLDGAITGKDGKRYEQHAGFCLEPQHFPDSPNHPEFPTTELTPGQTYHSVTVYRFSTRPPATNIGN